MLDIMLDKTFEIYANNVSDIMY